jgi:putative FmdB family regulatory protein
MIYEYQCKTCEEVFEVEKRMLDPSPEICPICGGNEIERFWSSSPAILFANRPIWTYNDVKKYKTFRQDGGQLKKVNPAKHGDMGAWHTDAEIAPEKKKKKKK